MPNNEKVIKKYTIEDIEYIDASGSVKRIIRRTCDGFDAYQLLGLVTLAQQEIIQQIKGTIRPDIVERKVVVRKQKNQITKI